MADQLSATRRKNLLAGWAADALGAVDSFARAPFGYSNPPVQAISNLLGVPGLQRTLDRVSYGEPLTTGKGQATRLRDDTVDALGFVPLSPRTAAAVVTNGLSHAAPGVEHAITLYHGSPEKITDALRTPYGGAYLAENPSVAANYANMRGHHGFGDVSEYHFDDKKLKVFDATKPSSAKILKRIEREYDNKTDYKDPDDGQYMPLSEWVKSGHLFKLGRKAQNEVMASLEAEGYDAVRYLDSSPMADDSISWVVFDNKNLTKKGNGSLDANMQHQAANKTGHGGDNLLGGVDADLLKWLAGGSAAALGGSYLLKGDK